MINISTISFIFILKIISKNPLKKEFISNTFSSSCFRFINNLHYYTMYYTIFIEVYSNYLIHSYFMIIKKSFTNVKLFQMVSAQGFEPRTHALEGRCSIQLSYAPMLLSYFGGQTRFELATSTLARLRSTTELLPHDWRE